MELRRYDRYRLGAPAVFSWEADGVKCEENGTTRDISTTGIYLLAASCPPEGITVQVLVSLPSLHPSRPGWRLETEGKVVRVESRNGGGKGGFALQNNHSGPRLKSRDSV